MDRYLGLQQLATSRAHNDDSVLAVARDIRQVLHDLDKAVQLMKRHRYLCCGSGEPVRECPECTHTDQLIDDITGHEAVYTKDFRPDFY